MKDIFEKDYYVIDIDRDKRTNEYVFVAKKAKIVRFIINRENKKKPVFEYEVKYGDKTAIKSMQDLTKYDSFKDCKKTADMINTLIDKITVK